MLKVQKHKKRDKNGKVVISRYYYMRYRLPSMPREKLESLKVTDKEVAEKKAKERYRELEREAAGIIEPASLRDGSRRLLSDHLSDYLDDLKCRGCDGKNGRGARQFKSRVTRLIEECQWTSVSTVTPDSFLRWRNRAKMKPITKNLHLQFLNTFFSWLERNQKIARNPLRHVEEIDERGTPRRVRRAFTDEELIRLREVFGISRLRLFRGCQNGT